MSPWPRWHAKCTPSSQVACQLPPPPPPLYGIPTHRGGRGRTGSHPHSSPSHFLFLLLPFGIQRASEGGMVGAGRQSAPEATVSVALMDEPALGKGRFSFCLLAVVLDNRKQISPFFSRGKGKTQGHQHQSATRSRDVQGPAAPSPERLLHPHPERTRCPLWHQASIASRSLLRRLEFSSPFGQVLGMFSH